MLLHISALHLFFVVIWGAIIQSGPKPKETIALSIKDKPCLKVTPTLNISEVCVTTSELLVDSSASTLKHHPNASCVHAAYLMQKLCDITKFDGNLTKTIEANVTTLLSTNHTNMKWSDFCPLLLEKQKELGYIDKSDTDDKASEGWCTLECVEQVNETYLVKPVCSFILWSWTYIKNHSKGVEALNIMHSAPKDVLEDKSKSVPNQGFEKPDNSKLVNQPQMATQPPVDIPNPPQTPQGGVNVPAVQNTGPVPAVQNTGPVPAVQNTGPVPAVQNTGPAGKADIPHDEDENMNVKDASTEIEDPRLEKIPKVAKQPSTQINRPSNPAENENNFDPAMQQGLDVVGKNPTHAKMDEDETFAREDINEDSHDNPDNEDQGVNLEPLHHKKLPSDDKKDVQGVAKNLKDDFKLEAHDNGEGEDPDDDDEPPPKRTKEPVAQSHDRMSTGDEDNEAEDSHFFGLFFIATFVCIVFYLIYQNKRKIIAMALEGKKGRHSGRRRPTTASYQKLDNKLDEVMASSPPPPKTHVIY